MLSLRIVIVKLGTHIDHYGPIENVRGRSIGVVISEANNGSEVCCMADGQLVGVEQLRGALNFDVKITKSARAASNTVVS